MSDTPLKILAVDDTPQNLLALQALIREDGVELLTARSGEEALELLLQHDVALALLDVQMPGMDGYALAELMRGADRTRHVPIIFLTAGGSEEARPFRGYEAGAVDFLIKPLDAMVLRSKVRVFVDLHRQRVLLARRLADQNRLRQLNRTMLAALSHDIRTPLTALALNAELLLRRGDDVGRRVKSATAILSRQVDHLVNLASQPDDEIRLETREGSVGELVGERVAQSGNQALMHQPLQLNVEGNDLARFDPVQLAEAIDHLLLQAAGHAGDGPVRVLVDGQGHHAVAVRLSFDAVLDPASLQHLIGSQAAADRLDGSRIGAGLEGPERIARAHGGSLIGRSKDGQGTLFELMLPRGVLG